MADLNTYRNLLRINKHRLDDELEIQPELLERISTQVALMNSRSIEAHDQFKQAEAAAFADAKAEGESDKRAEIGVKRNPQRVRAWQQYQAARSELEEWQGLYEAWKQRGYSLKELVSLYVAQYFSIDPNHNVDRRDRPQAAPPRRDYSVKPAAESREQLASRIYDGADPPPRTRRRVAE